jgi:VWFA-related protein
MRKLLLGVLFFSATNVFAQLVESIEVRVTNVDVVVTDKKGNRVTGLTKDDFLILERGQPQTITNFYEVREEAAGEPSAEAPVELRTRRVVFFVDNYSIHPFRRKEIFKAIDQRLDQIVRPGDEAMIVTWSRDLRIELPFTSDRAMLRTGMKDVERNGAALMSLSMQRKMAQDRVRFVIDAAAASQKPVTEDELTSVVRAYGDDVAVHAQLLMESINTMLIAMSGLEGKKVFVYAGAHLPEKPAADMYLWLSNLLRTTSIRLGPTERSIRTDIVALGRNANANGVTMYMIDTGDLEGSGADEGQLPDRELGFTEFTNSAQAFQTIARMTGGVALTASRNFDVAVEAVARDLGSYYSLGYRPADDKPGLRRLEVKARNPEYTVRSRSSYAAKSVEQQVRDRVVSNIYTAIPSAELAVSLVTGTPKKFGGGWKVPITVTIPPELTLVPQGDGVTGGFTVYVVVGDERGGISRVSKEVQPIRMKAEDAKRMMEKPLVYTSDVIIRRGQYTMSVAIVDQVTNIAGFARARVVTK